MTTKYSVIDLPAAVQSTVLNCLSQVLLERKYSTDQHIIFEGEKCDTAYFIVQGSVQIYRSSLQGRQHILLRLVAGQAFNTVPLFLSNGVNSANAVALTEVTCLVLHKEQLDEVLSLCPELSQLLLHDFAEKLSHLSHLAGDLALSTVRARLARFLLDQVKGDQTTQWTHEQIAAHVGSVREVISRTLRDFLHLGYIRKTRHRLEIIDAVALEREVEDF
ncbi:MAG: Crp/Fnr family transcriptional regulator [Anaerolineae bacterium]|nr:Crp/Fnr family transcriptional regulator [Anaerolineae bacterium]